MIIVGSREMKVRETIKKCKATMIRYFELPKCKPWDIKKGRRFPCCHTLIEDGHHRICLRSLYGVPINIVKVYELSARDIAE